MTPFRDLASMLNLFVSLAVLAIGITACFVSKTLTNPDTSFLRPIFLLWLGHWAGYAATWLLTAVTSQDQWGHWGHYASLISVDITGLFALAFSYAFMKGDQYSWRVHLKPFGLALIPLVLADSILIYIVVSFGISDESALTICFALSQILSVAAVFSLAMVFCLRYGSAGVWFALACVIYAVLQRPGYQTLFIQPHGAAQPWILVGLASGKVVLASLFFALFFERAPSYRDYTFPIAGYVRLRSVMTRLFEALGVLLAAAGLGAIVYKMFGGDTQKFLSVLVQFVGGIVGIVLSAFLGAIFTRMMSRRSGA